MGKKHECPKCKKIFNQYSDMRRHKEQKHDLKLFPCHKCQKTFATKSNCTRHEKGCMSTQKDRSVQIKCRTCLQTFPTWNEMYVHRRQTHEQVGGAAELQVKI